MIGNKDLIETEPNTNMNKSAKNLEKKIEVIDYNNLKGKQSPDFERYEVQHSRDRQVLLTKSAEKQELIDDYQVKPNEGIQLKRQWDSNQSYKDDSALVSMEEAIKQISLPSANFLNSAKPRTPSSPAMAYKTQRP